MDIDLLDSVTTTTPKRKFIHVVIRMAIGTNSCPKVHS